MNQKINSDDEDENVENDDDKEKSESKIGPYGKIQLSKKKIHIVDDEKSQRDYRRFRRNDQQYYQNRGRGGVGETMGGNILCYFCVISIPVLVSLAFSFLIFSPYGNELAVNFLGGSIRKHTSTMDTFSQTNMNEKIKMWEDYVRQQKIDHMLDKDVFHEKNTIFQGNDVVAPKSPNINLNAGQLIDYGNDVNVFVRRIGELPTVRNANEKELFLMHPELSNDISYFDIFGRIESVRNELSFQPQCMCQHDLTGYPGNATNMCVVWDENNRTVIHALNIEIIGFASSRGFLTANNVISVRHPNKRFKIRTYDTIWIKFIDADLKPIKTSKEENENGDVMKNYDSRETRMRIEGTTSMSVQIADYEMKGIDLPEIAIS